LSNYTFDVHFKRPASISTGAKTETPLPGAHGGLIIQTGKEEYWIAGTGMIITFGTHSQGKALAGIDSIWDGPLRQWNLGSGQKSEWRRRQPGPLSDPAGWPVYHSPRPPVHLSLTCRGGATN